MTPPSSYPPAPSLSLGDLNYPQTSLQTQQPLRLLIVFQSSLFTQNEHQAFFSCTLWQCSKIIWARCFQQKQGGRSQVIRPFCRQMEDGCTAELLWVAFSHISWKSWATSDLGEVLLSDMCHRNHVFSWCLATRDKTNSTKWYKMSPERVVPMEETACFHPMCYDIRPHFLILRSSHAGLLTEKVVIVLSHSISSLAKVSTALLRREEPIEKG